MLAFDKFANLDASIWFPASSSNAISQYAQTHALSGRDDDMRWQSLYNRLLQETPAEKSGLPFYFVLVNALVGGGVINSVLEASSTIEAKTDAKVQECRLLHLMPIDTDDKPTLMRNEAILRFQSSKLRSAEQFLPVAESGLSVGLHVHNVHIVKNGLQNRRCQCACRQHSAYDVAVIEMAVTDLFDGETAAMVG